MTAPASPEAVSPPKGWLALAGLGAIVWFLSELALLRTADVTRVTRLTAAAIGADFPLVATAATVLVFAGLVGSLWRANRAAGATGTARGGWAVGALGTAVLLLAGVVLPVAQRTVASAVPAAIAQEGGLGILVGTALAFVGLALLCEGLALGPTLFPEPDAGPAPDPDEPPAEDVDEQTRGMDMLTDLLKGV